MRKVILLVFTVTVSTANLGAKSILKHKNLETMQKQDKEAIETLLQNYKRALNTSDAHLAQSLYTKDGIFMPGGASSAIGSENILKS